MAAGWRDRAHWGCRGGTVADRTLRSFRGICSSYFAAAFATGHFNAFISRQESLLPLEAYNRRIAVTQIIDFRFELLFGLLVLISAVMLVAVLVLGFRGRRPAATRWLRVLGAGWAVYLLVVSLVAAATPQRIIPLNSDLCSDELCFAVVNVLTARQIGSDSQLLSAKGMFYIVTVRLTNHGRGKAQSERGLHARLWSPKRAYEVSNAGQRAWNAAHPENTALTTRVLPRNSALSDQVFDVSVQYPGMGLALSNGFTPGYFVIGECPLFHKPTILRLSR